MHRPYAHCPHCGHGLPPGRAWPKRCAGCGRTCYLSPAPVGVVLQPVDGGILLVQRGIPPQLGAWALPGGFIDAHEGWREGCARELWEETGVAVPPEVLQLVCVESAPEDNMILLLARAPMLRAQDLPPFQPNLECTAIRVAAQAERLAFPLHTQAMARFFSGAAG